MKQCKTLLSIVMAIMMLLTMIVPTLAVSGTNANDGKITIDNAVKDQTYTIYQILKLESYNTESGAHAYKATDAWKSFVEGTGIKDVYLKTDDQGYVTWVGENTDTRAAAFAKLAEAWAETNITYSDADKAKFEKTAASTTVEFTELNLGYYLVTTSLGTLCSLDTTNPNATIKEKNGVPTLDKKVEEDSTGSYGSTNDADIGQTVNYQATIIAQAGAENYVFHDKMSEGLTYGSVTGITLNGTAVDAANYTVKTTELTDGCTFEVIFTQDFCDTLKANDKIVISYTATVNDKAVVGLNGNANDSWLDYGDKNNTKSTPKSETITYTWDLDVLKYANGDESKVLKDAQFVLLNSDKTKVATVVNGKLTGWVDVPTAGTDGTITWPADTVLTTDANGKIEIDGLDADTYYLREIKAPAGYNKLADDVTVVITGATKSESSDTLTYTTVVAKVNNQSGTELPSTGGIGTTIFYCAGAVLALGAFVLLVTKKRMGKE